MGDTSPQWYYMFRKVYPETRGVGAVAYREEETGGFVIIVSMWAWVFIAERVEPMRRSLRL